MTAHDEIHALRELVNRANDDRDRLLRVVTATLMFHSTGPWDVARREEWTRLTGAVECSTKSLCDFARSQLEACQ